MALIRRGHGSTYLEHQQRPLDRILGTAQFMPYHLHRYCTDIPSGLKDKNKPPRTHLHDSLRSWRALFRSVAGPEGRKGKPVIGLSSVNGRLGVLEGVGVDQPEIVC